MDKENKTLAAVLETVNQPLKILELDIPPLQQGQVLVEMAYSGICRTQINEIKGHKGEDKYLPHTLGHEGSGIVLDVGEGVEKVQKGDKVVLSWLKGKGLNSSPIFYTYQGKKINSGPISTFLSKAVISENRLVKIPQHFSLKEACLLGCAFPTGAGIILNQMKLAAGKSLAIVGLGGIGLSALLAAKLLDAGPIIAIDVQTDKLNKARSLGASHVINASKENAFQKVLEITKQKGVDFALECAGSIPAMETAFQIINENHGLCVIAGNAVKGQKMQIDPFDLIKGKRIIGSWGGASQIEEDLEKYIDLHKSKKVNFLDLITHEIKLSEINDLIANFDASVIGRSVISFK